MVSKLHISPILTFIASLLITIAGFSIFAGTPWPPFLMALGQFLLVLTAFLVAEGFITLAGAAVPNLSPILAFIALIFNTVANEPPVAGTPYQALFTGIGALINAISVFLVAEGVITAVKTLKPKLKLR